MKLLMPKRKRVYKKRKTKVRFYLFKNLRCQGRKELRYLKECDRYGWPLPIKPERVETPFGYYTPDFEYEEMFIEIKCWGTFLVCMGKKAYKGIGEPSDLQWKKILHVNEHIKPVHMRVYLSKRESKPILPIEGVPDNIKIDFIGGYTKKVK